MRTLISLILTALILSSIPVIADNNDINANTNAELLLALNRFSEYSAKIRGCWTATKKAPVGNSVQEQVDHFKNLCSVILGSDLQDSTKLSRRITKMLKGNPKLITRNSSAVKTYLQESRDSAEQLYFIATKLHGLK